MTKRNDLAASLEAFAEEIKSGRTIQAEFFAGLEYWTKLSGGMSGMLIHAGDALQERSSGIRVLPWNGLFEAIGT